jgi:flagellar M-ring protein FliF
VALLGLGVFSLLMLKSFVSAVPVTAEPQIHLTTIHDDDDAAKESAAATSGAAGESREAGAKPKSQRTLQRRLGSGPSLREELIEMVREDPEAAANILRGWIGNTT